MKKHYLIFISNSIISFTYLYIYIDNINDTIYMFYIMMSKWNNKHVLHNNFHVEMNLFYTTLFGALKSSHWPLFQLINPFTLLLLLKHWVFQLWRLIIRLCDWTIVKLDDVLFDYLVETGMSWSNLLIDYFVATGLSWLDVLIDYLVATGLRWLDVLFN